MTDTQGTPDTQPSAPARLSRPARIALGAALLAAVVLFGLWFVRITPWSADAYGRGEDRGIAGPGLTVYAAGDRDPAPPLAGRTLDDTDFNLDDLSGQIVVINVWGSCAGRAAPKRPVSSASPTRPPAKASSSSVSTPATASPVPARS